MPKPQRDTSAEHELIARARREARAAGLGERTPRMYEHLIDEVLRPRIIELCDTLESTLSREMGDVSAISNMEDRLDRVEAKVDLLLDRLDRVEAKVDLLLAHFGLTEEEEEW